MIGDFYFNYYLVNWKLNHKIIFVSTSLQQYKDTIDPYNNKTTYDYDPVTGLLEELIQKASSGNNIITEYDYDIHGRLTQVSQSDSQNNYEYENGKLKKIHVNGYYYEFIYDSFNRLSQVKVNAQTLVSYDYYS